MVGEFPELQGLVGGYYAVAQGEDEAVANAIRDHYKPVGQGDDVPTDSVTVAVALADKLDTIGAFFTADERPTGSRDPYALRRSALGVLALVQRNSLSLSLIEALVDPATKVAVKLATQDVQQAIRLMARSFAGLDRKISEVDQMVSEIASVSKPAYDNAKDVASKLAKNGLISALDFFADRLKVQQREAGVRHDLIDAVFALGGEDDLVRLLARVRALQSFVDTDDGANLLAGYKRAANILKKEDFAVAPAQAGAHVSVDQAASPAKADGGLSYTPEKDEAALIAALDAAEPAAAQAIEREDFEGAMAALATLRAPIDAFFDSVTVNDKDQEKRSTRLILLARVRAAVHKVADFSRIEG